MLLVISSSFLLKIRNVSDKFVEKIKKKLYSVIFFFFENRVVYEIMWKSVVQPGSPQMAIWRIPFSTLDA